MGIIQGFSSKLKSQSETKRKVKDTCPLGPRSGRRERALIKIEDPLLMKYAGYKYPRTLNVSGKALSHDHNVVKDGVSVGKKLVISKGITERGKSRRLLIENKKAISL